MADSTINFRIGSAYNGEGFKAAQSAVNDVNTTVKKSVSAMNQLSGALGESAGAAGKAANAVTGMVSAFMSGGISGAAMTLTMMAVNKAMSDATAEAERLKKASEELTAQVNSAFNASLATRVSSITAEVKNLTVEFDRVTAQAVAVTAALNGLHGAQGAANIINLEVEKYNAVMAAASEAEKANVAATYDLKIAKAKEANSVNAATDKLNAATQARVDAENRLCKIYEQYGVLQQNIAQMEEISINADAEKRKQINAEIQKLKQRQAEVLTEYNAQQARINAAKITEQTASVNLANVSATAALETKKAADNIAVVAEKAAHEAESHEKVTKANDELAEQRKAEKDLNEDLRKSQQSFSDATRDVAQAERNLAEAIATYQANYSTNRINEGVRENGTKPMRVQVVNRIAGDVADHNLQQAIQNGVVTTVKDANRFQRQALKDAQKAVQEREKQLKTEMQRYERLQAQSRKTWSRQDADFVKKFEEIREAEQKQKQDIIDKQAELQKAKDRAVREAQDIADIKQKLDNLGLK